MVNFILLAKQWPNLMTYWESIESKLPAYEYKPKNLYFFKKIKIITVGILVVIFGKIFNLKKFIIQLILFYFIAVEHSMSIAGGIYRGSLCLNSTDITGYFREAFPQINFITGGSYPGNLILFLTEFLNFYCVMIWTFIDIFTVSISICLSTRFNQFNEFLIKYKGVVGKHTHTYSLLF